MTINTTLWRRAAACLTVGLGLAVALVWAPSDAPASSPVDGGAGSALALSTAGGNQGSWTEAGAPLARSKSISFW